MSERSLLPVIIPARRGSFQKDFPEMLSRLLASLEIDRNKIALEMSALREVAFAPTRNRRVLGVMNDFAWNAEEFIGHLDEIETRMKACLWLADMPSKAIGRESPDRFTRYLFAPKPTIQ